MGTIITSLPTDGSTADVSDYNTPITTIVNELNGNLDNANIKSAAAIDGSKLADDSILAAKIVGIDRSNLTTDSNPYKFSAYRNSAQNTGSSAYGKITFDTENYDTNSNFASGTYTAPVAGFYHFSLTVTCVINGDARLALYKNGSIHRVGTRTFTGGAATLGLTLACDLSLAANDTIEIYVYGSGGAVSTGAENTFLDGHLISRT